MSYTKKAVIVTTELMVRVIIDDHIDPDVDHEVFDKLVLKKVQEKLKIEGVSAITENIIDIYDDTEVPYNPEIDE